MKAIIEFLCFLPVRAVGAACLLVAAFAALIMFLPSMFSKNRGAWWLEGALWTSMLFFAALVLSPREIAGDLLRRG